MGSEQKQNKNILTPIGRYLFIF